MRIRFLEIAEIELDEAIKFYNHESPELGDEFLMEVVHALDRIARFPEACIRVQKEPADIRHAGSHTVSSTSKDRMKF